MGEGPPAAGLSNLSIVEIRLVPTACAIAEACTGELSSTPMEMITVFRSALAVIWLRNSSGDS
jgi:hypothetical protein